MHSPSAGRPPLKRKYGDLDYAISKRDRKSVLSLFPSLGYEAGGLCRTVQLNIPKLLHTLDEVDVDRDLVRARVAEIQKAIDAGPKPLKWRLRAQVGDRLQWYELPEEVRSPYQPE